MSGRLLVVLDVDSTLTRDEGIDLLAARVSAEVAAEVADITRRAMLGELDFEQSLRARVKALAGLSVEDLELATAAVALTEGAEELVRVLHEHGHVVGAVSGGFHQMIDPIAAKLGLDVYRANTLEIDDGALTGGLSGPVIGSEQKKEALLEWAGKHAIPLENTVAVGDGGNDVEMLRAAGLGVAFMAKPVAREAADVAIETPDLTQVLDLLGFVWR